MKDSMGHRHFCGPLTSDEALAQNEQKATNLSRKKKKTHHNQMKEKVEDFNLRYTTKKVYRR